ncbi:MAG: PKD domain-containing protein [Thermoplasmata archaeon]|nr:PKD domain-containing protein [Thermoplasmata archaeon]
MQKNSVVLAVIFVIIILIVAGGLFFFWGALGLDDDEGDSEPETSTDNEPPVSSFEILGDTTVHVNDLVDVDGSASSDPDGEIVKYRWDFGDGNLPDEGTNISKTNHTYAYGGEYTINLTVRDDDDAEHSSYETITVIPRNYHKDGYMFIAVREGLPENASEEFEVEEEALQINVTLDIVGVSFDGGLQDAEFEFYIYDPYGAEMRSEDITVTGSGDTSFSFTKSDLKVFGDYTLEAKCNSGGGYITYNIDVTYKF